MNDFLWIYLAAFTAAFLLTGLAVPLCKRLAFAAGFLDVPLAERHKHHQAPTPLLGGLAMFIGWSLTIGSAFFLCSPAGKMLTARLTPLGHAAAGLKNVGYELAVLWLCALAALLLGLADDKKPMKAGTKFLGQLAISLAAVLLGGLRISLFVPNEIFSCAVTVFWLLFLFNAINFFDNMDGLAAGTGTIAFLLFGVAAFFNHQYLVASLCACSCGCAGAFWLRNTAPASIFMGDAGSHFLAFLLGVVSIKVSYFNPAAASTRFAVLIPLFILAVPIFDTLAVVAIRLYQHKPVYVGDNNHISHRFLHAGMTRKQAVAMVHLMSLTMGLGSLPLLWGDLKTCAVLLVQGAAFLYMMSVMQYIGRNAASPDGAAAGREVEK